MDFFSFDIIAIIKKYYLYIIIAILSIVIIILLIILFYPKESTTSNMDCTYIEDTKKAFDEEPEEKVTIDIKGEVVNPGVYKVDASSIVNEAINLAGGLNKSADTSEINLSQKVVNEMVINIPSKSNSKISSSKNSTSNKATSKISLNKASLTELMTLTGIGNSKAKSIIEYRQNNGAFNTIDEIKKVKGIGESLYAKIKDHITI